MTLLLVFCNFAPQRHLETYHKRSIKTYASFKTITKLAHRFKKAMLISYNRRSLRRVLFIGDGAVSAELFCKISALLGAEKNHPLFHF